MIGLETTPSIYDVLNAERPKPLNHQTEVDAETFDYFLGIMPPMGWKNGAFYVCEADSHTATHAIHSKFSQVGSKFYHEYAAIPLRRA